MALLATTTGAGLSGGTSAGIDTTGAQLLVIATTFQHDEPLTVADSKANTWVALTAQQGVNAGQQLYYVITPTAGTGHTFTVTGSVISFVAAAFSEAVLSFDQQNGAEGALVTTLQTGSVTPSVDGELLVTGLSVTDSLTLAIGSGFTIAGQRPYTGGSNYGCGLAYKVQTSAAPDNPTWSWGGAGTNAEARIATFRVTAAPAGGGATLNPWLTTVAPYTRSITVSPSNSVAFANVGGRATCDALYVGGAGTVAVVFEDEASAAFTADAGQMLPVKAKRVNSTGTTATLLLALYRV